MSNKAWKHVTLIHCACVAFDADDNDDMMMSD